MKRMIMTQCEVCKNDYDKPLEIVVNGVSHYFDCFECAIHALFAHGDSGRLNVRYSRDFGGQLLVPELPA